MDDPLFYVRALHFAATLSVAGVVFFIVGISEPALRDATDDMRAAFAVRSRLAWIAWISLVLALLSGVPWLALTAESMSGQPLGALSHGVLWTVLSQTDFGNNWLLRFVVACLLGGVFVHFLSAKGVASPWLKTITVLLAGTFVGTLAFAGHAIGGEGIEGVVHPAADVLHLIAAAAWVGALVPLALLLTITGEDAGSLAIARTATLRFSTLGIVCVATLLLTGVVNSWYLVGSVSALTGTGYGQLLLCKLALFAAMVGHRGRELVAADAEARAERRRHRRAARAAPIAPQRRDRSRDGRGHHRHCSRSRYVAAGKPRPSRGVRRHPG